MGIVAGFLVQNSLKHLLEFGQVTNYLGYSALTDFFPTMNLKPNPNCDDSNCQLRQKEAASRPKKEIIQVVQEEEPLHEDNEWGISLVDESAPENSDNVQVTEGISLAYTLPTEDLPTDNQVNVNNVSLDELMKQMKNI